MLTPIDTLNLLNNRPEQQVKAGEVIFQVGESGDVMYGLVQGTVEVYLDNKLIETLEQGDVFGEGALLHPDHQRVSNAIAKTDCTLVTADREHFMFAVQQTPMFALEVLKSYSDRFRRVKARLQALL
jgi:CRP-like cAMP-binding protein